MLDLLIAWLIHKARTNADSAGFKLAPDRLIDITEKEVCLLGAIGLPGMDSEAISASIDDYAVKQVGYYFASGAANGFDHAYDPPRDIYRQDTFNEVEYLRGYEAGVAAYHAISDGRGME